MDHQQITFVTLNIFLPLNPPPSVLKVQYQAGWNTNQK